MEIAIESIVVMNAMFLTDSEVSKMCEERIIVPVASKYLLTIQEAAAYFGLGEKKIRDIARTQGKEVSSMNGNKLMINRKKFEKYLDETFTI